MMYWVLAGKIFPVIFNPTMMPRKDAGYKCAVGQIQLTGS